MPDPLRSRTLGTFTATGPTPVWNLTLWQVAVSHHSRPAIQRLHALERPRNSVSSASTACAISCRAPVSEVR